MLDLRTILHPTDFSPSAAAACMLAAEWARRLDAELQLLHVVPAMGPIVILDAAEAHAEADPFYSRLWEEIDRRMDALLDSCGAADLRVRRFFARGSLPAPVIVAHEHAADVDLIVLGTHGGPLRPPEGLGSGTAEVLECAGCPVLVVQEDVALPRSPDHLLFLFAFTQPGSYLLEYTQSLAQRFDATLDVLYLHHSSPAGPLQEAAAAPVPAQEEARLHRQLDALLHHAEAPGVHPRVHIQSGDPLTEVTRFVRESNIDLLVLPNTGLPRTAYSPLGHTVEHLISEAACPTLVVRPSRQAMRSQMAAPREGGQPVPHLAGGGRPQPAGSTTAPIDPLL